jgi:hypothetical protein
MKSRLLFLFLVIYTTASGQLVITPGAELTVSGTAQLTLNNSDLVNNGNFTAGNGKVSFTGNAISNISGSQTIQFHELEINKTSDRDVLLQRSIKVLQQVRFNLGYLNLNGFDIDLGSTGVLTNENEVGRITGINGGQVVLTTTLNAPLSVNPGNLGAIITSMQNLGAVIVRRGHRSQQNTFGSGSSILRYYDILPANNTGLNATFRFNYFSAELNGLSEPSLVFWRSANNNSWTNEGITDRNINDNFAEKTTISSFSRWTLSSPGNALPVQFILFNVKCEGSKVLLSWKTAQEQNSSHFTVEKKTTISDWTATGTIPAAGNSINERSYSFTDNTVTTGSYYRIAQFDIDGRVQYSSIIPLSCDGQDGLKVWPNPFTDVLFVNIVSGSRSPVSIRVYDIKGALVSAKQVNILPGSNQFSIDLKALSNGAYQLVIQWNDGQVTRAIIK